MGLMNLSCATTKKADKIMTELIESLEKMNVHYEQKDSFNL